MKFSYLAKLTTVSILKGVNLELAHHIRSFFPKIKTSRKINFKNYKLEFSIEPEESDLIKILGWPPNIFIILYTLVEYTDKYRLLVAPQDHFEWSKEKLHEVDVVGSEWKDFFGNSDLPKDSRVLFHMENVFSKKSLSTCIYDLVNNKGCNTCLSIFTLLLSIDKIFENGSFHNSNYKEVTTVEMGCFTRLIMSSFYKKTDSSSSITGALDDVALENSLSDNDTKFGFVSYKNLLPQSGLTINNLCHNLTYLKPSVTPQVVYSNMKKYSFDERAYNVLFIPWPFVVSDDSFSPTKIRPIETDAKFDFFSYSPIESAINFTEMTRIFLSAVLAAIKNSRHIDLIILPECALSEDHYKRFKNILNECFKNEPPSFLSGVYGDRKNQAHLSFVGPSGKFETLIQNKHHRWCLDRNQIRAYNLASRLDPGKKWWEDIGVARRSLVTLNTPDGIKLCPLVCEDLARQEPVAQAVRALGPNFVVSLLLDGPQITSRWPGKYATVLSDDPGSSVLSITSLGMTQKSTGLGHPPSRTVALWSEPGKSAESVDLDEGGIGIIFGFRLDKMQCWSTDGRVSEKTIPRKDYHTTLKDEFKSSNIKQVKDILKEELIKRSVKK